MKRQSVIKRLSPQLKAINHRNNHQFAHFIDQNQNYLKDCQNLLNFNLKKRCEIAQIHFKLSIQYFKSI